MAEFRKKFYTEDGTFLWDEVEDWVAEHPRELPPDQKTFYKKTVRDMVEKHQ